MSDTLHLVSTTDTPAEMQAALARATGEPVAAPDAPAADGAAAVSPEGAEAPTGDLPAPAGEQAEGTDPKVSEAARVLAEAKKSKAEERKASIQAEIDEANWRKHRAREQAEQEEQRLAAARAAREALEKQPAEPAAPDFGPKPQITDASAPGYYADYDQFVEALADWKAEHKVAALRAEIKAINDGLKSRDDQAKQTTEQQQIAELEAAHTTRVTALAATQTDYAETMAAAAADPAFNMPPMMLAHMVHSDLGPQLAYKLAKLPPTEFRAIADLPPNRMVAALGRLEGQILASRPAAAPPTGPAAKAPLNLPPPPPKPVSGSSSASTKSPDQMTPAEYSAWRRKTRAS